MLVYKEGAQFLAPLQGGLLQLRVFDAGKHHRIKLNPKQVYALVVQALQLKPFLDEIIARLGLVAAERKSKLSPGVATLAVYDLLFSKLGRIQLGKHPLKDAVLRHKTRLQAEHTRLKIKHKVLDLRELVEANTDQSPVRWFRTNLLKTTTDQVLAALLHLTPVVSLDELTESGLLYRDEYIADLFGVHPLEKLTLWDLYKRGQVIIQLRPSCFPAAILAPTPGAGTYIDATAAPGNKTTHLALLLGGHPKSIYAFERNQQRATTLREMVTKAGGLKCIQTVHADFTTTRPEDFPDTVGLIVDPSCSGLGIFGRGGDEETNDGEADAERLRKLAAFQFAIVKHAMRFPAARKVVYSTCSIHAEENERVVLDLLMDNEVKAWGWRPCTRAAVLPAWPRRGYAQEFTALGSEGEAVAEGCVRALPKVDGGIGFFAAAFERAEDVDATEVGGAGEADEAGETDEAGEADEEPFVGFD